MKNQLPNPPAWSEAPRPQAWGYRSRYFPQDHATVEIPVYQVMLWGCLMCQRPVNVYRVGLN